MGVQSGETPGSILALPTFTYDTPGLRHRVSQDTGTGTTLDTGFAYDDAAHRYSPTRYTAAQGSVVNYGYDTAGNLNCLNRNPPKKLTENGFAYTESAL